MKIHKNVFYVHQRQVLAEGTVVVKHQQDERFCGEYAYNLPSVYSINRYYDLRSVVGARKCVKRNEFSIFNNLFR